MQKTLLIRVASIALAATMVASVLGAQDGDTLVTIWDGVYTAAQAERGKAPSMSVAHAVTTLI